MPFEAVTSNGVDGGSGWRAEGGGDVLFIKCKGNPIPDDSLRMGTTKGARHILFEGLN